MADIDPSVTPGHIRFSTSILSRLGEELNPNIDQGLLELVKNAYDADATECHVWLESGADGRSVVVEDNGYGMDSNDIISGWLVLGSSEKRTDQKTPMGRTPAGNKGLGRLAALRLGHRAVMRSRPEAGTSEFEVVLDWDEFDRAATVDTVEVDVTRVEAVSPRGTRIELSDMRRTIGRVDARRLARALVLLADPFTDEPSSFKPYLHSQEFDDLARTVSERYFDQAEFHLVATLRDGVASARVVDWRGETLWEAAHTDLRSTSNVKYSAPDSQFDLWAFILSPKVFSTRPVQLSAVREWLGHFGGVHVYSNELRVAPYGNPGNDWLDLNLSRVRSPEERPGTNTSIGRLKVVDPNGILVQKTDRSGFIESEEFHELRQFAVDALDWMARRRVEVAEHSRRQAREAAKTNAEKTSSSVREQIAGIADGVAKSQLQRAFDNYDRAREKESDALRKEVQLYRTLSTAGITAATFAHESNGNPLKRISLITNTLRFTLRKDAPNEFEAKYRSPLDGIASAVESLTVLSSATLRLIDQDKRREGKLMLNQTIREVATIFEPFLTGRNVALELDLSGPQEPFIRGTAAAMESVVTNLINNSLAAFEHSPLSTRRLLIRTRVSDGTWEMTVADNGPGIEGISLRDIWLPGQTQRPGGTGLGLTIVRDSLADLGGDIRAEAHGELGGATFIAAIPLIGAS